MTVAFVSSGPVLWCSGDNPVDGETKAIVCGDLTRGSSQPLLVVFVFCVCVSVCA